MRSVVGTDAKLVPTILEKHYTTDKGEEKYCRGAGVESKNLKAAEYLLKAGPEKNIAYSVSFLLCSAL